MSTDASGQERDGAGPEDVPAPTSSPAVSSGVARDTAGRSPKSPSPRHRSPCDARPAHGLQAAIDRGEYRDQADAARQLGLTRARVTELMNLTLLAPEIQEAVLFLEAVDGREPLSKRELRTVVFAGNWRRSGRRGLRSRPPVSAQPDFLYFRVVEPCSPGPALEYHAGAWNLMPRRAREQRTGARRA